jgi:hypothetical protein
MHVYLMVSPTEALIASMLEVAISGPTWRPGQQDGCRKG